MDLDYFPKSYIEKSTNHLIEMNNNESKPIELQDNNNDIVNLNGKINNVYTINCPFSGEFIYDNPIDYTIYPIVYPLEKQSYDREFLLSDSQEDLNISILHLCSQIVVKDISITRDEFQTNYEGKNIILTPENVDNIELPILKKY